MAPAIITDCGMPSEFMPVGTVTVGCLVKQKNIDSGETYSDRAKSAVIAVAGPSIKSYDCINLRM